MSEQFPEKQYETKNVLGDVWYRKFGSGDPFVEKETFDAMIADEAAAFSASLPAADTYDQTEAYPEIYVNQQPFAEVDGGFDEAFDYPQTDEAESGESDDVDDFLAHVGTDGMKSAKKRNKSAAKSEMDEKRFSKKRVAALGAIGLGVAAAVYWGGSATIEASTGVEGVSNVKEFAQEVAQTPSNAKDIINNADDVIKFLKK